MALEVNDLKTLKAAFAYADHDFKQGFVYITEDAITNRIEEVDPAWMFEIQRMDRVGDQTVVCARMTIKDVSREGVGMQMITSNSNAEPEKGAATDALKRCARLFGIGRYLLNAPKQGDEFNRWLAVQQKTLNGVKSPEGNGHEPDSVRVEQSSAKVVGVRPTPPPASVAESPVVSVASGDDPLADFGTEQGDPMPHATDPREAVSDDDPNVRHVDHVIISRSKGATQVAFAIVNSPNRIPVIGEANINKLTDLYVGDEHIMALKIGSHELAPTWKVYADHDKDGWHISKIETGIPVNGVS